MSQRGRPAATVRPVVFSLKLCLYPGRDDALIAYLQAAPPRLRAQYLLLALQNGQLPSATAVPRDEPNCPTLDFADVWQ